MFNPWLEGVNRTYHFGHDGVVMFFVLSGFVITWCARERDLLMSHFIINRASRIYSVAGAGLLLGAIASVIVTRSLGQTVDYQIARAWVYFPVHLTFTGWWWGFNISPPGDYPYWSLYCEVWYYLIFALFFYLKGSKRWLFSIAAALFIGPRVVSLFPLWMAGSWLYFRIRKSQRSLPDLSADEYRPAPTK